MQLLMRRPEINGFVSISPPANLRDFSFLAPCPSPGLIVHGDKDNISSFDSTKILVEKLQKQKKVDIQFKPIRGADHFYENFAKEFDMSIKDYIEQTLKKINVIMTQKSDFINEIKQRGFVYQAADIDELEKMMSKKSVAGYIGFDITNDSLHIGSLVQLMLLKLVRLL